MTKIEGIWQYLCLSLMTLAAVSYPLTPIKSSPFSINPATHLLIPSVVSIEDGKIIVYTIRLDSATNTSMLLYRWNATPDAPTILAMQTGSFPSAISNIIISVLANSIRLSYLLTGTGIYYQVRFRKTDLFTLAGSPVPTQTGGIYLPRFDLYLERQIAQNVFQNPEGTNTLIATYTTPTTNTQTIKYLLTPDNSKVFTFYQDKNFFLARNVTSNIPLFATDYPTPTQVTLPAAGVQCACFTDDSSAIFILDMSGNVHLYHVIYETFQTLSTSTFFSMQKCYYDPQKNGVVFHMVNPPATVGTYLWLYSVITMGSAGFQYLPEQHFTIDSTSTYMSMETGSDVKIYQMGVSPCAAVEYYDSAGPSCLPCPTGCAKCISSTICLGCSSGYTYNYTSTQCEASGLGLGPTQYQEMIDVLIANRVFLTVNKVPGSRKIIPALCFFINIDELWLYQYHERNYGITMKLFFGNIQKLENEKWNILEDSVTNVVLDKIGTSKEAIYESIDTKKKYTPQAFRNAENRGETFLPACWQFLTFNLFFVLISFLLLKWGFKLLFQYQISILLRSFSSLVFLAPMLLDGNLQYFFFLLFSQISRGFSLNPKDKALNALNYIVYFFVLWFAVVSCFLCYYINRKLTKYIIDNWRTRVFGLLTYSITNAIRMLILGAIHSLIRSHHLQLPLLMGAQLIYIILLILSMSYWRVHKVAYKIWFVTVFALLRLCLQVLLWVQQSYKIVGSLLPSQLMMEEALALTVILYMFTFYFATAWEIVYQVVELIKPKEKTDNQQNESNNENEMTNNQTAHSERSKERKERVRMKDMQQIKETIKQNIDQVNTTKSLQKNKQKPKCKIGRTQSTPEDVKEVRFKEKTEVLGMKYPVRQELKQKNKLTLKQIKNDSL